MAGGARDIYSWSCLPSLVVGFFLYLVFFVCHISHQGRQFHHNKVENTHLDIHRQAISDSTNPSVLPQVDHRQTITQIFVNMTPAHPQAASRPRLILRSDSFTHEDLSAAFAASASQPRTKDLKIRIAQKDETPAPPPSPTEAFSSHRP
ncbi:hypothetical protein D6D13_08541 [Aureobasidium pullulans]|uniref:Uncharacterized protein n=1 Tax=Aureobasidium pullulans TaxID=5580 RepID=A0A4S9C6B9_AURPU|nr:hypothetical protein D6D13_08541 [Aureobasidium pullulans]